MLLQIIYLSKSCIDFSQAQIEQLARRCAQNNQRRDVTGVLYLFGQISDSETQISGEIVTRSTIDRGIGNFYPGRLWGRGRGFVRLYGRWIVQKR